MLPALVDDPAGIPDFATRDRLLEVGPCNLAGAPGRGSARSNGVDVSVDGGGSWSAARLGAQATEWSWAAWQFDWQLAEPGVHEVCCRAVDAAGNAQPLEAPWNLGGYANNEVQRIPVTVTAAPADADPPAPPPAPRAAAMPAAGCSG